MILVEGYCTIRKTCVSRKITILKSSLAHSSTRHREMASAPPPTPSRVLTMAHNLNQHYVILKHNAVTESDVMTYLKVANVVTNASAHVPSTTSAAPSDASTAVDPSSPFITNSSGDESYMTGIICLLLGGWTFRMIPVWLKIVLFYSAVVLHVKNDRARAGAVELWQSLRAKAVKLVQTFLGA